MVRGVSVTQFRTQIYNACILVPVCPNSITPYFLILRRKIYGQLQRAKSLEYFQTELFRGGYLCALPPFFPMRRSKNCYYCYCYKL